MDSAEPHATAPPPPAADSPAKALVAWMNERFPPVNVVVFFLLYALARCYGAFISTPPGTPIPAGWGALAAFAGPLGFFLMLRVFDEHKDYEKDCANFPDRVLQSGRITLGHLKVVGALAVVAQVAASLLLDGGVGAVTRWWALAFAWSLLMLKEFFIGAWLEARLLLYAASHMVVTPMIFLWMMQMGAGQRPLPAREALVLAGLSFFIGASAEVGRKFKAPADERPGVDSYTKSLGVSGASLTLAALLLLTGAFSWALLGVIAPSNPLPWRLGVLLVLAPGAVAALAFRRFPTPSAAKAVEGAVMLGVLLADLLLLIALVVEVGVSWN